MLHLVNRLFQLQTQVSLSVDRLFLDLGHLFLLLNDRFHEQLLLLDLPNVIIEQ